ncbi:MAG: type II secretion system F family protein, partial [Elusimicrobiota bacterium]
MGRFIYTVQDAQGTVTTGALDAEDEDSAVQSLQTKGLFILSIQSENAKSKGIMSLKKFRGGSISGREMVFFGEQLSTLIGGGIPLVRALSLLSEHAENKNLAVVLSTITKEVSAGGAFHKALEKHPTVFDEIWVSLVQAGEVSGQLPVVLRQITAYSESKENVRSKIITAVSYPAVLMTMSVGVLIYFVMFIVPVFADIFRDFNLKLPILTRTIVGISAIMSKYLVLILVSIIGSVFAFRAYIATTPGRLTWNHIQMNMPLFGTLIRAM